MRVENVSLELLDSHHGVLHVFIYDKPRPLPGEFERHARSFLAGYDSDAHAGWRLSDEGHYQRGSSSWNFSCDRPTALQALGEATNAARAGTQTAALIRGS